MRKEDKDNTNIEKKKKVITSFVIIGYTLALCICMGILFYVITSGDYFSRKETKERNIKVLDSIHAYKGSDRDSLLVEVLRKKNFDVDAKDCPLLHTVKVKGVEVYDNILQLEINNYKYFMPDQVELYPEILNITPKDICNQIKKNKRIKKKEIVLKDSPLSYMNSFHHYRGGAFTLQYIEECLKAYDSYVQETGNAFNGKAKEQLALEDYEALVAYIGEHMDTKKYPLIYTYFYGGYKEYEKQDYRDLMNCFELSDEAKDKLETILEDINGDDYSHYDRYGASLVNNYVWDAVRKLVVADKQAAKIRKGMSLEEFIEEIKNIDKSNKLDLSIDNFDKNLPVNRWIDTLNEQLEEKNEMLFGFHIDTDEEEYFMIISNEKVEEIDKKSKRIMKEGFDWWLAE